MTYPVRVPPYPITLELWYIVQYWDNWGIERDQYIPPTEREYRIESGPYGDYLTAVLALMEVQKQSPLGKFDLFESAVTGKVYGFDPENL